MKVLHVYSHDNPRLAKYVSLLLQTMPADVECVFADNASDVRLAIKDFRPDIIHQHGRFPTLPPLRLVASPHGETIDTHGAYVVIARSPYELTNHKTDRKELVGDPLITRTITFGEAAATIASVYQRVMDSNPLELMSTPTRRLMAVALKAGLLGDKGWVEDQDWQPWVEDCDFHHLYIYVRLEGVADIVTRGFDNLGITPGSQAATEASHTAAEAHPYLPQNYQIPQPMAGAAIVEMLRDIEKHGVCLLRLTELTKALHNDRLDEEALMVQADSWKLGPLFQSVLQLLSEQTLLTEGFMPCQPIDNTVTDNLRQQIENHLHII